MKNSPFIIHILVILLNWISSPFGLFFLFRARGVKSPRRSTHLGTLYIEVGLRMGAIVRTGFCDMQRIGFAAWAYLYKNSSP